jgi:hypothetical protein
MNQGRSGAAWRERARQNAKAASVLSARNPSLPFPAVSRLYYACFQAVVANLLQAGHVPRVDSHGEVWRAAESIRPGLGGDLQDLYGWRRKADYATGDVTEQIMRELVTQYLSVCASLGVEVK